MDTEDYEVEKALAALVKGLADGSRCVIVEPTRPGTSILAGFSIRFSPPSA